MKAEELDYKYRHGQDEGEAIKYLQELGVYDSLVESAVKIIGVVNYRRCYGAMAIIAANQEYKSRNNNIMNRSMTTNVENWTYKSRAQLMAASDEDLLMVNQNLREAIPMFREYQVHLTDEMVWLIMVLPGVMAERNLLDKLPKNS